LAARRSLTRLRAGALSLVLAVLVGGGIAVGPWLLWGDRADYSHVVSIRSAGEYQSPDLLEKAWALPVARLYRSGMVFQQNASFCGPTSLVNVLHSQGKTGNQDSILADTDILTVAGMLPGGLTLDELAGLARQKLGNKVTVLRDLDLPSFRQHMLRTNDSSRRYVVNFSRGPLFGSGSGHHSPIAGYLPDEDLVLVLDVNRNFGPWLVSSRRLHEAMNTVDPTAGEKRGLLLIE
jgi:hypothetical protein